MKKRAEQLRVGDKFVCPSSGCNGRVERVTAVRQAAAGRVFVRTNHHDALRKRNQEVQVVR